MGGNKIPTSLRTHTRTESYSFETVLDVKELVYTWTIKNLASTHKKAGESIKSPLLQSKFKNDTWHWSLDFYPRGLQEINQDFTCLVLSQCTTATEQDQKVYLKICMRDGQNEEHVLYENFFTFSCVALNEVSVLNSDPKNKLSDWMISQDLKIVCKMYLNVNCRNSLVRADPVPRVEEKILTDQHSTEFDDFEKLLDNQTFSDVKLFVGEKQFFAHKNILAARSSVFADIFDRDTSANSFNIKKIDAEVMKEVLRFIYSGKVNDISRSIANKLLKAAVSCKLNGLKRICLPVVIEKLNRSFLDKLRSFLDSSDDENRSGRIDYITLDNGVNILSFAEDKLKPAFEKMSLNFSSYPIYCCCPNYDDVENLKLKLYLYLK